MVIRGGSTEAAASTNTQLCNSGGSSPFRRWSSLIWGFRVIDQVSDSSRSCCQGGVRG